VTYEFHDHNIVRNLSKIPLINDFHQELCRRNPAQTTRSRSKNNDLIVVEAGEEMNVFLKLRIILFVFPSAAIAVVMQK
jgi:hypothetical protein